VKRLDGKIAAVTGAARGLGRRICEALVREGARVAMLGRDFGALQDAARGFGAAALPLRCDVADPQHVSTAFAALAEQWGGLDLLVNNAAIGQLLPVGEADPAQVEYEVKVNLLGPIHCIGAALPLMRRRGGGDVFNISSESVLRPYPMLGVYAATKSGLETLSRSLRAELRDQSIRVGVLRVGRLQESGFNRGWPSALRARYLEIVAREGFHSASGEPIRPAVVADALIDLACLPREAQVELVELRPA
jgi:meso-butanediol dehydrogenase/(S,S)-butanediol dehydrogenase/diacetyl reductase